MKTIWALFNFHGLQENGCKISRSPQLRKCFRKDGFPNCRHRESTVQCKFHTERNPFLPQSHRFPHVIIPNCCSRSSTTIQITIRSSCAPFRWRKSENRTMKCRCECFLWCIIIHLINQVVPSMVIWGGPDHVQRVISDRLARMDWLPDNFHPQQRYSIFIFRLLFSRPSLLYNRVNRIGWYFPFDSDSNWPLDCR